MQRFALVGAGFIGSVHAGNLASHPGVDFALVYDVDADRAQALAARHGTRATTRIEDAFDPAHIDAVFIASSTDSHADNLRRAADAGLAALCEKPIDKELQAAIDVVDYVTAREGRVMMAFNRRFDRDYAALQRAVAAGEVGDVELIQMTSRGPVVPPLDYIKVSGGIMRDSAVHFFDLTRFIAGADPVEVFASGSALADPRIAQYDDVDTSAAILKLPSGAIVQIDSVRRTAYGYDERIEVMGAAGLIEAGRHVTGTVSRFGPGSVVSDGMPVGWFERVQPTYAATLDTFVTSLETGMPFVPSLTDGLKAQAIAEAATRSLLSGRSEPIAYPTPERPARREVK